MKDAERQELLTIIDRLSTKFWTTKLMQVPQSELGKRTV